MWNLNPDTAGIAFVSLLVQSGSLLSGLEIDPAPVATAVTFVFISLAGVVASVLFAQKKISEHTQREIRTGFRKYRKSLEQEVHGWP